MILDFLQKHPGEIVEITRIARHFDIKHQTVSGAITDLIKTTPGLERRGMGAYIYNPPSNSSNNGVVEGTGRLFEEIAELKDGQLLLRCEKGDLYIAQPWQPRLP